MGSAGSGTPLFSSMPMAVGAQLCDGQHWWRNKAFLKFFQCLSKFSFFRILLLRR